ncbi:MAG: ABC transporter, partial [Lentisphaeria bacterium]
ASIDYRAEENFFDLLQRLNQEVTIALVSHDIGFITSQVNRVACLNRRLAVHPTKEISSETLASVYETPVDIIAHQHHMRTGSPGTEKRPSE